VKKLRVVLISIASLALAAGASAGEKKSASTEPDLQRAVRQKLEGLNRYGVFDVLNYQVNPDGSVELSGFVFDDSLKDDAEDAVRDVPGVKKVTNRIEDLPWGVGDDDIRAKVYLTIYRDSFLSRYGTSTDMALANGVGMGGRGRFGVFGPMGIGNPYFPGFNPVGDYGIHIMVTNGEVTLVGDVDSVGDRIMAELKTRGVFPVKKVYNELTVKGKKPDAEDKTPTRTRKPGVYIAAN